MTYSLSPWERVGVRAPRARLPLLDLPVTPPPLALTLTLSQRERELRARLSQRERELSECLPQ